MSLKQQSLSALNNHQQQQEQEQIRQQDTQSMAAIVGRYCPTFVQQEHPFIKQNFHYLNNIIQLQSIQNGNLDQLYKTLRTPQQLENEFDRYLEIFCDYLISDRSTTFQQFILGHESYRIQPFVLVLNQPDAIIAQSLRNNSDSSILFDVTNKHSIDGKQVKDMQDQEVHIVNLLVAEHQNDDHSIRFEKHYCKLVDFESQYVEEGTQVDSLFQRFLFLFCTELCPRFLNLDTDFKLLIKRHSETSQIRQLQIEGRQENVKMDRQSEQLKTQQIQGQITVIKRKLNDVDNCSKNVENELEIESQRHKSQIAIITQCLSTLKQQKFRYQQSFMSFNQQLDQLEKQKIVIENYIANDLQEEQKRQTKQIEKLQQELESYDQRIQQLEQDELKLQAGLEQLKTNQTEHQRKQLKFESKVKEIETDVLQMINQSVSDIGATIELFNQEYGYVRGAIDQIKVLQRSIQTTSDTINRLKEEVSLLKKDEEKSK